MATGIHSNMNNTMDKSFNSTGQNPLLNKSGNLRKSQWASVSQVKAGPTKLASNTFELGLYD